MVRDRQKGRMSMDVKDTTYTGTLQISVVSALGMSPIPGATVTISYTGDPDSPIETLTTDESGQTPEINLKAPPRELSLTPDITEQPYSEYNIQVTAEGFETVLVSGSEILAGAYSLQPIRMNPLDVTEEEEKVVVIPPHTLFGEYPPKIPEEEIKPMNETGEIVLSRVVIPEYVIVHDGDPEDPTARNYWVRYKDYIKNVASSEIYPTWSESAIYANILVIQRLQEHREPRPRGVGGSFHARRREIVSERKTGQEREHAAQCEKAALHVDESPQKRGDKGADHAAPRSHPG